MFGIQHYSDKDFEIKETSHNGVTLIFNRDEEFYYRPRYPFDQPKLAIIKNVYDILAQSDGHSLETSLNRYFQANFNQDEEKLKDNAVVLNNGVVLWWNGF